MLNCAEFVTLPRMFLFARQEKSPTFLDLFLESFFVFCFLRRGRCSFSPRPSDKISKDWISPYVFTVRESKHSVIFGRLRNVEIRPDIIKRDLRIMRFFQYVPRRQTIRIHSEVFIKVNYGLCATSLDAAEVEKLPRSYAFNPNNKFKLLRVTSLILWTSIFAAFAERKNSNLERIPKMFV